MPTLIALLIALQSTVVIPSPPAGIGPYQGPVSPPPPLELNEVEREMWNAFGTSKGVMFITCDSPDIKARIHVTSLRFVEIDARLRKAVDRTRGGRIFRDSFADMRHAYIPGCPPQEAINARISTFERSLDALDSALTRVGY